MSHIDKLKVVVLELHCVEAKHRESVPVKEFSAGRRYGDGIVEVFDIEHHPDTDTVYAWLHDTGKPGHRLSM
jgi:hypothetical protein